MFSGKPILMSGDFKDNTVSLAKCGFVIPAENSQILSDTILKLQKKAPEVLDEIGRTGKAYLLKNFTYEYLAKRYISEVFEEN